MNDQIADLVRRIELADMVAYAGSTWDWHRLHYDPEFLHSQGLDVPVVDGQELGAFLAEHVLDHYGPTAFITRLRFRLTAMVFAGDTIRVSTTSLVRGDSEVTVEQSVSVGERVCATGATTIRLGG